MAISIGIPFYNAEAYLADAIRSVFAQTYRDWELILVDDGSTDHSLEIALSIKDSRVRVLSDGHNRRLPYRLNQITAEAQYDLVGRMDADDLISPTRFEKQLAILDIHPEIDLVTTGVCSLSNDNRPVGIRCGSPDDSITGRKLLLGQCAVVHAAMLGRKTWFLRNPYDVSINRTEDYELWLRAFDKNDFNLHIITEPLYYYREEDNVTAQKLLTAYASQRDLFRQYGHVGFSCFETPFVIARIQCKALIVRLLAAIDRLDLLLARRNSIIGSDTMRQHFETELSQILSTPLPV